MRFILRSMFFFAIAFISMRASGTNFYVRQAATGTGNGSDWNNAWPDVGSVTAASVACGDTVWVAAGTYKSALTLTKLCSASQPITINKVLSSDQAPAAAAGWSASFDGVVTMVASPAINIASGSSITIDGRSRYPATGYGIQIMIPASGGSGIVGAQSGSIDNVRLYNIEVTGPYCTSVNTCSTAAYGIDIAPSSNVVTNLLISNCSVHGISEAVRASNWNGVTVEYNRIADTIGDGVDHEDVMYSYPSSNVIWRYNIIKSSPNDGLFFEFGGATNFSFYGNVFYASSFSFLTTKAPGSYGPIYIYNNVFHAPSPAAYGFITSNGSTMSAATQVFNNVFYNVSNSIGAASSGYNAYSYTTLTGYPWPSSEVGSFTFVDNGNLFQSVIAGSFQPLPGSPLIGKGKPLAADGFINKDMDGRTRGSKGSWDVGAYEFQGITPSPATNLNVVVH